MKMRFVFISTLLSVATLLLACKKETAPMNTPNILVNSSVISVAEDSPSPVATIQVALSTTYNKVVTLDYSTSDSTATAGADYTAIPSGTLTFQPGDKVKYITVNILRDTANKHDCYFRVLLKNAVNAEFENSFVPVRILNVDYATLVWSDEFTDPTLNTSYWNYELGNNGGWGNNELENYTNSPNNVHLDTGYLHITAHGDYTSGRITTEGKKEFTYGKVEIRAKLPEGQGLWPALWMLGSNITTVGWPACGEIDMMELLGQDPRKVYGTVHYNMNGHQSSGSSTSLLTGSFSDSFHLFTFIWTPNHFSWLIDNQSYYELNRSQVSNFPFDLPEFFIFNVAIGGNWPGPPDNTTVFPQNMTVDYIRLYQ